MTGNSGILKGGSGTLILTGNNTYTGNTIVARGTLDIRKSITSDVRIDQNGTLIINPETKIGTLNSDGTVNIKNSVHNLGTFENRGTGAVITGDYIAEKDSVTIADINSKLTVKGKTEIKGNTRLQIVNNGKYITAKPLISTVLLSENGINGNFSHIETPELTEGKSETSNQ